VATTRDVRRQAARGRHARAGAGPGQWQKRRRGLVCEMTALGRQDSASGVVRRYAYTPDREGEQPRAHLREFTGTLQADEWMRSTIARTIIRVHGAK
jgi:hypothetical protein